MIKISKIANSLSAKELQSIFVNAYGVSLRRLGMKIGIFSSGMDGAGETIRARQ